VIISQDKGAISLALSPPLRDKRKMIRFLMGYRDFERKPRIASA
jgi:hypothetical protein